MMWTRINDTVILLALYSLGGLVESGKRQLRPESGAVPREIYRIHMKLARAFSSKPDAIDPSNVFLVREFQKWKTAED